MSVRSVLLPITGYEADDGALVQALTMARQLGAFVEAVHVKPDPRDSIPFVAEGAAGPVVARIIDLAEKDAESRAGHAARLFESACGKAKTIATGANAAARFSTVVGRGADEVSLRARVADLVATVRVTGDNSFDWRITLEATLMEGGRPVLILPATLSSWKTGTVAIAWNGSIESARAASGALPFLAQADRVLLLSGVKDMPIEPSLDQLAEWLGHHGVKAEKRKLALKGWPVEGQLTDEAAAAGADLLVMGGYGHSRLRETVFGGATRAVLDGAKLPVLLAH